MGPRVETDDPRRTAAGVGQRTEKVALAATDFDKGGIGRHLSHEQLTALGKMALPDDPVVEHPVRTVLVGDILVPKTAVPHVGAIRALDEIVRKARHRQRLFGRGRPSECRQGMTSAIEEGDGDAMTAHGAGRGDELVDGHAKVSGCIGRQPLSRRLPVAAAWTAAVRNASNALTARSSAKSCCFAFAKSSLRREDRRSASRPNSTAILA